MDTQNQLPPPALAGLTEIAPLTSPIIISDLHLAPTKPKTIMAFVRFMKTIAPRYPELVILGDLFDYWIGDDAHPEAQPVIALLKLHAATGRRVIVMPGNRDVMLGAAFARAAGAELIRDPRPERSPSPKRAKRAWLTWMLSNQRLPKPSKPQALIWSFTATPISLPRTCRTAMNAG